VAGAHGRGENLLAAGSSGNERRWCGRVLARRAHWFMLEENLADLGLRLIPNGSGPHC
jgi:hypothetical protein